jgi:LuxR family maltose regulon positive regulatory protein
MADSYVSQGGRRLPQAGRALNRMGLLQYEWNDLDAALQYATSGVELCKQWGWADFTATGYTVLAQVLWATGDTRGARDALQEIRRIARSISPRYEASGRAHEAYYQLRSLDIAAASRWVRESGIGLDDELAFDDLFECLIASRILLAEGKVDDAQALLSRILNLAEATSATLYVIRCLVLQALAYRDQVMEAQALRTLERALLLAEPQGYIRTFVDEGRPLGELVRKLAARGTAVDYATRLLSALAGEGQDGPTAPDAPLAISAGRPAALVEPLRNREQEVLRLLATNLSTTEIADQLYISVHTVRSHVKSIYSKLDVHSRMEAVVRARELELL